MVTMRYSGPTWDLSDVYESVHDPKLVKHLGEIEVEIEHAKAC